VKILSWNIRQGGGSRLDGILAAITDCDAGAVLLSEFRTNQHGDQIRAALSELGYTTQIHPDCDGRLNSVLAASRMAAETDTFPDCDPEFPHSLARLRLAKIDLYGVYLPHKKKHQLFPFLESRLTGEGVPSIVAGDFNTGMNLIDQKGKTFWYTRELRHLNTIGYVDAFRHVHGKLKREYSWFSHGGNGYRYDHTWVHESLVDAIVDCRYLHEYREAGLSDHSPMVLELEG